MVVLIIGFFVVFAAFRLPRELSAAIAFDRGETAESKHDYKNAAANYEQTLAFYPKATLVWERMAVAANRSGDKEKRNQALNTLADLARADPNSDAGRYLFKATMEMNGPHP
jgi:predicted TPR repeat methyltransferase